LPLMRPNPRGELARPKPRHVGRNLGIDHIGDEHREAR
jgi:hypothetical protein